MTNIEREKSLRKSGKGCNQEPHCLFCKGEATTPCAKAYNRMTRYAHSKTSSLRSMWEFRRDL